MAFQLGSQCFATIVCHIKRIHSHAYHLTLLFLHREAWVKKEDRIAFLIQLRYQHIDGKRCLHTAYGRHDALGRDVQVHKRSHELATPVFHLGDAGDERVFGAHASFECFVLSGNTYLFGWQSGFSQFHVDKLHSCRAFDVFDYAHELANRRCAQFLGVAQTKIDARLIYELFVQWKAHNVRPLCC